MSAEQNAAIVQDFYALVLAGEVETAAAKYLSPDFAWDNPLPDGIPYGGKFEGPDGAGRYLALIFETLDLTDFGIDEVVANDDHVVLLGHETAEVKKGGGSYTQDWVHVLRLSDGKITYLREYNDTAKMKAAF